MAKAGVSRMRRSHGPTALAPLAGPMGASPRVNEQLSTGARRIQLESACRIRARRAGPQRPAPRTRPPPGGRACAARSGADLLPGDLPTIQGAGRVAAAHACLNARWMSDARQVPLAANDCACARPPSGRGPPACRGGHGSLDDALGQCCEQVGAVAGETDKRRAGHVEGMVSGVLHYGGERGRHLVRPNDEENCIRHQCGFLPGSLGLGRLGRLLRPSGASRRSHHAAASKSLVPPGAAVRARLQTTKSGQPGITAVFVC